ncbi:MAG: chemotaxis protein CheX [Syntrophobacteraceae bacterium]
MRQVISEVLETMFFVAVNFIKQDDAAQTDYYKSSIMLSNDKESVNIFFRMTHPFSRMITANFLGSSEEGVRVEEVEDVMKELANMVGGNYMRRTAQESWQLGIPSTGSCEDESAEDSERLYLAFLGEYVGTVTIKSSGGV